MYPHPITGGMIEDGIGSHPVLVQAARHCDEAEAAGDVDRADDWRKQLGLQTSVEREAKAKAEAHRAERHANLPFELEKRLADLEERFEKHLAETSKETK